jgi:putative SOS response-associated peptidase YedK
MCARVFLAASPEELVEFLDVAPVPAFEPRFNIAPSQDLLVGRLDASGQRHVAFLRWGLIPRWSKDPKIGTKLINARSETAAERGVFAESLRTRRCLVPAGGFYEWRKIGTVRQPYLVRPKTGLLAIAGLWDSWERDGQRLDTCTLLTTTANATIAPIHDRMPVLLDREQFGAWLDPGRRDPDSLAPFLRPYPADRLVVQPVSTRVNRPDFDDPACLEVVEPALPAQGRLF